MENISLNSLFENIDDVKKNGKLNAYALKYQQRKQSENFSICLPENINPDILSEICKSLSASIDKRCVAFNPTGYEEDTYEYLAMNKIDEQWQSVKALFTNKSVDFKGSEPKKQICFSNLTIIELDFGENTYYLCTKQKPSVTLFYGKTVFLSANDEIRKIDVDDFFMLDFTVDFIISPTECADYVFILNRKNFVSIFNYYEYLQNTVKEKLSILDDWQFLTSSDLIKGSVQQKNVYTHLSKVFDDEAYLKSIKETTPKILKNRLLEKSKGAFSKKDFEGDKLLVTRKNLGRVMRMLSKAFKHDFFADAAEE